MNTLLPVMIAAALILPACDGGAEKDTHACYSRFGKTWPDASDLAWFQEAKGKSKKEVLAIYGPPVEKTTLEGGRTSWRYPWAANAQIKFVKGVATRVFYTSGY